MSPAALRRRILLTAIVALTTASSAAGQELPTALVLSSGGATYIRAKDESSLPLHDGQVLFSGDRIHAGDIGGATLLLCPAGQVVRLPAGSAAEVGNNRIATENRARITARSLAPCRFPKLSRTWNPGDYYRGASMFGQTGPENGAPAILRPGSEADIANLVTRLAAAEESKQDSEALAISDALASYWQDAAEWRTRTFVHSEDIAARKQPVPSGGHGTYAVVIGISQYRKAPDRNLQYADADAQSIYDYLTNARGAAIPRADVALLLNEKATLAAIRNAFARVASARAERVFVFIAAHGVQAGREAYVIANDTDPQALATTAIPMSEINADITSDLAGVKTVFAWVDTCNSAHVEFDGLYAPPNGELYGLAASKANEQSLESPGLKHGVFTYFLDEALNRASGQIPTVHEFVDYVYSKVRGYTSFRQTPRDFGDFNNSRTLASLNLRDPRTAGPAPAASGAPSTPRQSNVDDPLLALENRGQNVILRYLDGEEDPVSRADFLGAESDFTGARRMAPESLWLEAREDFCAGRVAVFDKQYDLATQLLTRAIQLDPSEALAYNALGVEWLERADYARALAAFDDAIRRSPRWAYAWHNRALAYTEAGNYGAAIRDYRHAMEIAPHYFYLPYNLGVLYQTLNRRKDAEAAYDEAIRRDADRAEPYNARGTLRAAEGKRDLAERDFETAIQKNPNLQVARDNLAALLAQSTKKSTASPPVPATVPPVPTR